MEVSGTSLATNSNPTDWSAVEARGNTEVKPAADKAVPEQDTVSISPAALKAQEQEHAEAATATPKTAEQAPTATETPTGKAKPSDAQSFVYGALGLERPEKTADKTTDGYTAGRWLAATVTAGAIISILV